MNVEGIKMIPPPIEQFEGIDETRPTIDLSIAQNVLETQRDEFLSQYMKLEVVDEDVIDEKEFLSHQIYSFGYLINYIEELEESGYGKLE